MRKGGYEKEGKDMSVWGGVSLCHKLNSYSPYISATFDISNLNYLIKTEFII